MVATRQNRRALLLVVLLVGCSSGPKAALTPTATARGRVVVPNVVGMRVCDALPVLGKAGLIPQATLSSEIDWIVGSQTPAAGTTVERDATEALTLNPADDSSSPLSRICQQAVETSRNSG